MLASDFYDLASGRRRGWRAAILRAGLAAAAAPYGLAVRWRNRRFDAGHNVESVPVPVVSVGNLTAGGTGKTPMVEWIARWFRSHNVRVTIVSRGYGAEKGELNDEGRELEARLIDVPHLQNPYRAAAARLAIEEFDCQLVLLDDGFQHRRLARDLDVVMIDSLEPFGYERLLPRGLLREPPKGLKRAQIVVLSRADCVSIETRDRIAARVARLAPDAAWVEVAHAPQRLLNSRGETAPLDSLAERRVAAFCGIGNPRGFRRTIERCGYQLIAWREFPDHHAYTRDEIDDLAKWAGGEGADAIICTHKDLVKIQVDRLGGRPLWAVGIALEFLAGRERLEIRLQTLLPKIAVD